MGYHKFYKEKMVKDKGKLEKTITYCLLIGFIWKNFIETKNILLINKINQYHIKFIYYLAYFLGLIQIWIWSFLLHNKECKSYLTIK